MNLYLCGCLCINGKPFTCAVHLWVQYTAGLWYRRALSAYWKAHHASGFGHSNALIEAAGVVFLSLTGNCRSELRPPDEHYGTRPSAASRYDPLRTRNRSISDRIQNIMRGWYINSAFLNIMLRQILAGLQSADIRLQSACACQIMSIPSFWGGWWDVVTQG